jgi:polypeptide N-acetylgalactosaminyltransferase
MRAEDYEEEDELLQEEYETMQQVAEEGEKKEDVNEMPLAGGEIFGQEKMFGLFKGRVLLEPGVPHDFYSDEELQPCLRKPLPRNSDPGEFGKGYVPQNPTDEEKKQIDNGWERHGFNEFVCNKIALTRHLSDKRPSKCMSKRWKKPLPTTSVVIVFHNEATCTLLRTVYSILGTTPKILLTEIILVDDKSEIDKRPELGVALEQIILDDINSKMGENFVKIIRQPTRLGLIQARLAGAAAAKGDTLTFLDAHCECFPGWAEPLLERVAEDPTRVMTPVIEVVVSYVFIFYKALR